MDLARAQERQAWIELTDDPAAVGAAPTWSWPTPGCRWATPTMTKRLAALEPYQVDDASDGPGQAGGRVPALPPAHRGEEVTDGDARTGPRSPAWDEAENRIHTQGSVLALVFRGDRLEDGLMSKIEFIKQKRDALLDKPTRYWTARPTAEASPM